MNIKIFKKSTIYIFLLNNIFTRLFKELKRKKEKKKNDYQ